MTLLIVDPWQYCVCCIRSGVTRCILLMVLYLDLCPSAILLTPILPVRSYGTILLTPYSMVWDWRHTRAGPIFSYLPKLLYHYYSLLLFSLSLLSVSRLVLWGWGLWTDRVYITLFQPCTVARLREPCIIIIILVFGKTLLQEFHISYNCAEQYLIFSRREIVL